MRQGNTIWCAPMQKESVLIVPSSLVVLSENNTAVRFLSKQEIVDQGLNDKIFFMLFSYNDGAHEGLIQVV